MAISARPYGQRAVLKFAQYTGCLSIAGRFTPGTFTNQITKQFREPRLLIITDPRPDAQVPEPSWLTTLVVELFYISNYNSSMRLFLRGKPREAFAPRCTCNSLVSYCSTSCTSFNLLLGFSFLVYVCT